MKFIHTADGPAPTQAEIAFFEQAGHKLANGMQEGTTRRSFETVGSTSAYLVAGAPGAVHIHTVKDDPKTSLAALVAAIPNSFGPRYTPPDFVSGFILAGGRTEIAEDAGTGCYVPQLSTGPVVHTEYVPTEYAARKLAAVGGRVYGATTYPPADTDLATYSQSSRKRPGYFTGHMASVVQMMLGGGRFLSPSVYELAGQQRKVKNPIGSMQIGFDARTGKADEPPNPSHYQYMKPFEEDKCVGAANTNDPFAMEVPWDYRWSRTHGVVFGLDKTITGTHSIGFVIDISDSGVYAYPVQVDPLTKYRKVQQYMAKVYPWLKEPVFNGMTVFDAFGGIPLPTYFPKGDLPAAVTKGKAVRLCDTGDFYTGGEFLSTMFGWAFSESTGEAANVVVKDPGGETTMKVAQLFKLKVQGLQLVKEKDDAGKFRTIVKGGGGIVKTKEGNLYHGGKPPVADSCATSGVPQFHVYEPVVGQMVSYDLQYGRRITTGKCDAPVFCCYIKDDLHILNYFAELGVNPTTTESDTREPCQVAGTWTSGMTTRATTAGHFYNSTTDFRREVAEYRSKTVTREWPAYDYTLHAQASFFSRLCVSRRLYFSHTDANWETSGPEGWNANVGVSSTDRSVYFVCTLATKATKSAGRSTGIVYSGSGPEVRWSAFYFFLSHWAGEVAPAPSAPCMEPEGEFVELVPSCHSGGTESLVGKVKHFSLQADGTESCNVYANQPTGGYYSGEGMLGTWIDMGGYKTDANDPSKRYPAPYIDNPPATGTHEVIQRVYIFGAPLADGRMIAESKATAPATDPPFGLDYAPDWFRFSMPRCPVTPMPVCRNFYGKDFMATYNDRTWSEIKYFGNSQGLVPSAIPVGGIMK